MASDRYRLEDIEAFVAKQVGEPVGALDPGLDLFERFRIDGGNCDEFVTKFSAAFDVNLSGYLWYFHHGEEPHPGLLFQVFWPPPDQRVARIPISPRILLASANAGAWTIEYPEHSLPKRRHDIIAGWVFLTLIVLFGVGVLLRNL